MRIPVQVKVYGQTVLSNALIDSGAEGKFINSKFVAKHRIPVQKLVKPIPVHNVDGTPNQNGTITHYTLRPLLFGNKLTMAFLLVTSLGKEDIILGLPWLKQRNPLINWKEGTISIRRTTTATSLAQRTTKTIKPLKDSIPAHYHNFIHLFEKKAAERFPIERPYDHAIDLKPDFIPRDCKLYSMTPKEELALDEFLTENLCKGYIRPSKSPMASPFFFVDKKDGTLRPCQDYRALNEGTIKNTYPLPLIGDLMDKLRNAKYFTKLDLRSGYNNIRIKEEEAILIYMDDILIFSDNLEDLCHKTNRVLNVLQENDLFLKPEKCIFEVQEVEFLGMIIRPNNIHMDPVKLAGIQQWPEPHTVKQLRSFLGFCNFYRRFIPNYSSIAYPLNELTRTNEPWKWNKLRTNAFTTLKDLFSSQLALLIPDKNKPFILETDASKVASGAVLYQANSNGDLQPCGFISEAFGPAQQRYEVYNRELLGVKPKAVTVTRNTFITTDDSADARCQLLNIKQTGTADNYNTQFRSLVTRSNISDKNVLSEMYQQGLTCGLIQRIYARDKLPDTMEECTTTTSSTPRSTCFKNLFSTTTSSSPTPTNSPNHPKKLTPEEREKCMKEGCCLACREVGHNAWDCTKYKACTPTTIHQVAPDPVPTTPAPAAAEPAKPTSKAEIITHIRSLLQNAGNNVAEEVLMELDNTDF
ncbi:hypothetical protein EW145_g6483 [Phellinidium pouzarii]|uniref:Reverse transcriptase domain-containing protein n=1 Tax=Phellinidium pouzarii TaxID=167371 RepID=A0A4S4KWI5_9AGAM|nr:hypothetical protein EW145_g6483 [Phellinidium pouzarii]